MLHLVIFFWSWILKDCIVSLKKERRNCYLVFTSSTKCEIKKKYRKGWCTWKFCFADFWGSRCCRHCRCTIHWGWPWFLPYFLAPLKKQHHNTTTEQQNFGTPVPQPSEEEYFYPKMKKKYFLWFIYIYSTTQIHVNVFQDSCLQSVIHLIINHLFGAYYGK